MTRKQVLAAIGFEGGSKTSRRKTLACRRNWKKAMRTIKRKAGK